MGETPNQPGDDPNATLGSSVTPVGPTASATGAEGFYLLVFHAGTYAIVSLPPGAELIVGRAPESGVRIDEANISRRHAAFKVSGRDVTVRDLDSQNGTLVNGERIAGTRSLLAGDTVSAGSATLVLYAGAAAGSREALMGLSDLRGRVDEELARSVEYDHRFTVACAVVGAGQLDEVRATLAVRPRLRRLDVAAWAGGGRMFVLFPEVAEADAAAHAEGLRAALATQWPEARVGWVVSAGDDVDAEGLLTEARNAALAAAPGTVAGARTVCERFTVDDRQVLVADPAMARLYALVTRLAAVDLPVLVCGETGTGKDLVAHALHERSPRKGRPLVSLNCAAIPELLLESALFGHEKGAFSGAVATKPGLLETADGGTVFLDEIGELPASAQAKLLRVIETKKVARVGDVRERQIDVRLVAATNRDLRAEVAAKRFRQDLYFRLGGATLWLPPLRERKRELPVLAQAFLDEACAGAGREPMVLSSEALQLIHALPWEGNVRELKNLMGYVAAAYPETTLLPWHIEEKLGRSTAEAPWPASKTIRPLAVEVAEFERSRILAALEATGGNQTRAAALLELPIRTFSYKMTKHRLRRG